MSPLQEVKVVATDKHGKGIHHTRIELGLDLTPFEGRSIEVVLKNLRGHPEIFQVFEHRF